jgi:ABC-type branched-subunit amino acid transport system substrate-binding protein
MKTRWSVRVFAIIAAFALVAAACGDDDDDDGGAQEEEQPEAVEANPATDRLVIGQVLPETGSLAFLGPPMIESVGLAVEDINAAGGVLGQPVEVIEADEGDDAARVTESANRVLAEGANAIVGAAASGQSQEIIQTLFDEQIPQCSPSNTAPDFDEQRNAGFYFRTVPPDQGVAPVFGDRIIADGHTNVAVAARQDPYGDALKEFTIEALEGRGATIAADVSYDPEATTFDAEVEELTAGSPDAIVVISFAEGGALIAQLLESGVTPNQLYGGDGVFGPTFIQEVSEDDTNIINGMTVIGAAGGQDFNTRLDAALPADEKGNLLYGGQSYDCVVLLALAAEAADSLDGEAIREQVLPVSDAPSTQGTDCASFPDCKALLDQGQEIDYTGVGGPLNLSRENGGAFPTFGRYAIAVFGDGTLQIVGQQDVDLSQV